MTPYCLPILELLQAIPVPEKYKGATGLDPQVIPSMLLAANIAYRLMIPTLTSFLQAQTDAPSAFVSSNRAPAFQVSTTEYCPGYLTG